MRRVIIGAGVGAVALALGALAFLRSRHPPPDPAPLTSSALSAFPHDNDRAPRPQEPPRVAAGADELAVVAPIVAGKALVKGWTVRDVYAVRDGTMRVACAADEGKGRVDLEVALYDDSSPLPPAMAGRYAIFYSSRRTVPEDAEKLAQALAAVIEKNQAAPAPKGMTKFSPKPKPPETL